MQLKDFEDYKNQLMEDLLTNPDIFNLINEEISEEDPKQLAYTQVFPLEYIPETAELGKTYICFDVDIYEAPSKTFYIPYLYVWVMTHKSLMRLKEGGVRTDRLCSEIAQVINGSRKYGLGELQLVSVKRFAPMTDYNGKVMTFKAKEFNMVYDGNKYTPTKRK